MKVTAVCVYEEKIFIANITADCELAYRLYSIMNMSIFCLVLWAKLAFYGYFFRQYSINTFIKKGSIWKRPKL